MGGGILTCTLQVDRLIDLIQWQVHVIPRELHFLGKFGLMCTLKPEGFPTFLQWETYMIG